MHHDGPNYPSALLIAVIVVVEVKFDVTRSPAMQRDCVRYIL